MNLDLMEFILEIICLKKVKDGAHVINLDEYADIGTHWIAFYVVNNNVTCSERFGIEHIEKKKKKNWKTYCKKKKVLTNIYRIQAYDSVIYGYFSVGVIDITLKGRSLTGFTIIVSPNNKKNMII